MSSTRIVDGSTSWNRGVDSVKVTTIQSASAPDGLARNEVAWADNCSFRDGGITQRTGWQVLGGIHDHSGLFQGSFLYSPADDSDPYHIVAISGHIYKVTTATPPVVTDLSTNPTIVLPSTLTYFYFVQAEQFLVIQAGDGTSLPLFWDGATLRKSKGIISVNNIPGSPPLGVQPFNELPAATAMDYYMGHIWYAQGRKYSAGDTVGNTASGTAQYNFTDSVLKVTESPLAFGGDGFAVPSQSGTIRALTHNANIDASLGQGRLFIGTQRAVYSLTVPVNRADWIATTANNQPLQTVVALVNGPVNDRSIAAYNGDLYYQSLEPGIRSLVTAIRFFQQNGNAAISANEQRILNFVDRGLLKYATGIVFNNRLFQSSLPVQKQQGVVHQAIIPLDFIPISSFGENLFPVWEGMYEGLDIFQMSVASFGGRERAFAITLSRKDQSIQLWEFTDFERFDNENDGTFGNRVTWQIEFPSFNANQPFELKDLVSMELWVDKLFGPVDFQVDFRPDGDPCWYFWAKWRMCTARNSAENVGNPITYPVQGYRESYRSTVMLPKPPLSCDSTTTRPVHRAYQHQPRITIKGWCRLRGMLLYWNPVEKKLYENLICTGGFVDQNTALPPTPPIPPPAPPQNVLVLADPVGNLITDPQGNIIQAF